MQNNWRNYSHPVWMTTLNDFLLLVLGILHSVWGEFPDILGAAVGPIFMTSEDGTHSSSQNAIGKCTLHIVQNP
jgi:hypothetical protein